MQNQLDCSYDAGGRVGFKIMKCCYCKIKHGRNDSSMVPAVIDSVPYQRYLTNLCRSCQRQLGRMQDNSRELPALRKKTPGSSRDLRKDKAA
jgi:hypothetical protein